MLNVLLSTEPGNQFGQISSDGLIAFGSFLNQTSAERLHNTPQLVHFPVFVLLGAGAAMGPLEVLLALGANVIAVDLNREQIWRRLITLARSSWDCCCWGRARRRPRPGRRRMPRSSRASARSWRRRRTGADGLFG